MKAIRINISCGAGEKKQIQVNVHEEAFKVYKELGSGKAKLLEVGLKDAYKKTAFSVLFKSKRLGLDTPGRASSPYDVYMDAIDNKTALIEAILIDCKTNSKYSVFFEDGEDEEKIEAPIVIEEEVIEEEVVVESTQEEPKTRQEELDEFFN